MKNTRVNYLYRDAGNYKMFNEAVVSGAITEEQIVAILETLDEGEYFLPAQVGLPEERPDKWAPRYDHPWFELEADGFEPTDDPADVNLTVDELVSAFERMAGKWEDHIGPDGREIIL